ncbi:NAD(P)-dependent alcohol dehydrogenase [Mesorhizobium sp. PAMC28654]|uniref:NAD(P)-dependent alcohol dehydrogenase n=1 Tax=Mesorhizobium sp. PAMC28654 TaxID=2880934 RepID=UPI001D0B83A4|nr:NAD(P)-dependent alcohol dehydrogenase [Mesorhizobium sp. PAMC28654]UDL89106.1 NAD(P)-dependent alcohol dehydrogenase [Mesorhizobium sp. PAMC28654]
MFKAAAFACEDATTPLHAFTINRRDPGPRDVEIEILFCGVCHSDLHTARGEWGNTMYPAVPGHEIVGRVNRVGSEVSAFKTGDTVGVGCIVDSCRACASCAEGLEQFCENGMTGTYNAPDTKMGEGAHTFGGYSSHVVVDDRYVLRIPASLDLAAAAPLLCAGITTYSPLRHWKAGPGKSVGIVGLGGLGHMGVKIAHAMGAHVTMITTSPDKAEDARKLGADAVIISKDAAQMAAASRSLDLIIDCVAADHDINAYLNLLKRDGALVQVGAPEKPLSVSAFSLIPGRRTFAGSMIGGIAETQEMLDFCAEHGIASDIEMIDMDEINEAYERMLKSDVRYRFVIDMATMPKVG